MLEVWAASKKVLLRKEISKRNEIIFNNKFIRLHGRMFFDEPLFLKNIYKLHHIVDKEGNIKSINDFLRIGLKENEINKINEIFENIPGTWRHLLKKEDTCEDNGLILEFILDGKTNNLFNLTSKKIYKALLSIKLEKSFAVKNIEKMYNYSEKDIQAILLRPRKSTLNGTLREFQFKMLYEVIYTKKHLHSFKISLSSDCSFCGKSEETYEHMFFTCEKTRALWRDCGNLFNIHQIKNISWVEVHIGMKHDITGKEQLINHIILLIKYLVFVFSRTKNNPPTPHEIKQKLQEHEREEKRLATSRGKLPNHLKKWEYFLALM